MQKKQTNELRKNIFLAAYHAGIGHIASSMSLVEIMYVLYQEKSLKYDVQNPQRKDRDYLVLSKGHGSLAQYASLCYAGLLSKECLMKFCDVDSSIGGEPIRNLNTGIESSTGSLGHGLSIGLGMALALKNDKKENKVFVIVGDGECQEGSIWEAIQIAPNLNLDNLILIVDNNGIQKTAKTNTIVNNNFKQKLLDFGWNAEEINGHDIDEIKRCLSKAKESNKPFVCIANTIKGKGISCMEDKIEWHYRLPKGKDLITTMQELDISEEELKNAKGVH